MNAETKTDSEPTSPFIFLFLKMKLEKLSNLV